MLPTSGLNVAIEPLRFDDSFFSLFLSQKKRTTELTESHTFDWKAFAAPLRIWRSIRTGCVWLNARNNPCVTTPRERERSSRTENSPRTGAIPASARYLTHGYQFYRFTWLYEYSACHWCERRREGAWCLYSAWGTRFLSIIV